jgi:hypothetical protein
VRTFKIFGLSDGRVFAAREIRCASTSQARAQAEGLFPECELVEVWEASVMIARIRRRKS